MKVTAKSADPAAIDAVIASLRQLLGARLSSATTVREQHGKDASYHPYVAPDAVAFAQSTQEKSGSRRPKGLFLNSWLLDFFP